MARLPHCSVATGRRGVHLGWRPMVWAGAVVLLAELGCNALWGIDELSYDASSGAAGAGAGAQGGAAGAMGGASVGGGEPCDPGSERPCYTGPAGTEDVGVCQGGRQICSPSGVGYGACQGEITPTVDDCATADDENCDTFECGETQWAQRFGDGRAEVVIDLATDGTGNVIVTGGYDGNLDFGAPALPTAPDADQDAFLAKLGPTGGHQWSKAFGGAGTQQGRSVAVDSGGSVVLVGSYAGDVDLGGGVLPHAGGGDLWVAKFNADGGHLWSKGFGDASTDYPTGVAIDRDGNIFVTGYFRGHLSFGGSDLQSADLDDAFLVKLDPDGNHLWSAGYPGQNSQDSRSVAVDSAGNVWITGYFRGDVDLGGGVISNVGDRDIFVAKFDPTGTHLYSDGFGDAAVERVHDIAVDSFGNAILVGYFIGSFDLGGPPLVASANVDLFVAKLDPGGAHLWSHAFGGANNQGAYSVAVDTYGYIVVAGYYQTALNLGGEPLVGANAIDRNLFVAKFDPDGNHHWSRGTAVSFDQTATWYGTWAGWRVVATDQRDNVFVGGYFFGDMDLGTGVLSSAGADDAFVAKLAP